MHLDGDLNFEWAGNRAGRTLLLVHAMGADLTFWASCRAVWEPHLECVAIDQRGAGRSPASAAPLSPADHAADLAAFCRREGLGPVIVVGCAVGAMTAALLAARQPDLVEMLVLSNPGYRIDESARSPLAMRAATARSGGMAAIVPAATAAAFEGCPDDERQRAYVSRFAAQDPQAYALQIEGMLEADISAVSGSIACPTLIVAGGRDRLLPPRHAEALHAAMPASRLVRFEDGAHFIPYQQPERFAHEVLTFIAQAGGGQAAT
jgi:3-oxoadipate enol-lactonase